eukprot:scaffold2131_cov59-Phaeocystis_antarctica.AAC.2
MGDQWWDNITLCEAGGHNFTQTTSTGLEFRCIVHDICKRPALSHNVRRHRRDASRTASTRPHSGACRPRLYRHATSSPYPHPQPHAHSDRHPHPSHTRGAERNLLGIAPSL